MLSLLRGIGRFCYEFVIGEDWKIAVGILLAVVVSALLAAFTTIPGQLLAPLIAILIMTAFTIGMIIDIRRK